MPTTAIYTLSLHDALPIFLAGRRRRRGLVRIGRGLLGRFLSHLLAARAARRLAFGLRSEEHTSELQSQSNLVCRLLLEKKHTQQNVVHHCQQFIYPTMLPY